MRPSRPFAFALAALLMVASVSGCRERAESAVPVEPPSRVVGDRVVFNSASLPEIAVPGQPPRPIRSVLNVPARMNYGDFRWDDSGVPPGKLWILVDIGAQTLSIFREGHEIGTGVMLYGAEEKPTPFGQFTVRERRKDYWSRSYDAPMPFMLRLTDDGVAIHGSTVIPGSATHGCLGIPLDFAKRLFNAARVGDEVFILRDARALATSGSAGPGASR